MTENRLVPRLSLQTVLYTEGKFSIAKAAMSLAMVDNDFDDPMIKLLNTLGCNAVITRAGGRGDNFKDKILRNTLSACEKSGLLTQSIKSKYIVADSLEKIFTQIENPMLSIAGGGVKIGILKKNNDFAVAVYGTIGIPGIGIDKEVAGVAVLNDIFSK